MKEYFSMSYTSFLQTQSMEIKDINSLLIPKKFIKLNEFESNDFFYATEKIDGVNASFAVYENSLICFIENEDIDLLEKIKQKYSIENNLSFYYSNIILQGKVFKDNFFVFSIVDINNNFSFGLYESKNILSILELPSPKILLTKIKLDDIILEEEEIILTQLDGIDYSSKVFLIR